MSDIDILRAKVFEADAAVNEIEKRLYEAKINYSAAVREYSNAVALSAYGYKIGDVIEFTEYSAFRKPTTKRIKITGFNAYVHRDYPVADTNPTIIGTTVRKDGSLGTRTDTCFPGSERYRNVKKIEAEPA